jgi:hypothetical protein
MAPAVPTAPNDQQVAVATIKGSNYTLWGLVLAAVFGVSGLLATLWPDAARTGLTKLWNIFLQGVVFSAFGAAGTALVLWLKRKVQGSASPQLPAAPEQPIYLPLPQSPTEDAIKKRAQRYVDRLHEEWFPRQSHPSAGEYRISLYIPSPHFENPAKWICLARSFTSDKPREWKHSGSRQDAQTSGIVSAVAFHKRIFDEDGVPEADRKDKAKVESFLTRTHLTEALHKVRRWKWASIMAAPGHLRSGQCVCVFVVERESGLTIETTAGELVALFASPSGAHEFVSQGLVLAADLWARLAQGERADE